MPPKKQTAKRKTQADRDKHSKPPSEEAIRRHMLKRDNCHERADMAPGRTMLAVGIELPEFVSPAILVTLEDALGIKFTGTLEDAIVQLIDKVLGEDSVKIILDAPPSDPALLNGQTDVMFVRLSVGQKPAEITEPEA